VLAECTLTALRCHFCGSALVRVTQPGIDDRLICPICWALGEYQAVTQGGAKLQRGIRIDRAIRVLVDKERFPRRAVRPAIARGDQMPGEAAPAAANGDSAPAQAANGEEKPDPA
jgi:hypothetical protein